MILSSAIFPTFLVAFLASKASGALSSTTNRILDPLVQEACPVDDDDGGFRRRVLQGLPLPAIIDNGIIKLGVNPTAQLNVPGTIRDAGGSETDVGLRYLLLPEGESESTSYGCECEGWGASADGDSGWANDSTGGVNVIPSSVTFTSTASTAISSVIIPGGKLRVTHDFRPSPATPNLYEVLVTLKNISGGAITDIRYRRVMDWDIYPTPFSECVTMQPDPSTVPYLTRATNNGFNHPDPLQTLTGDVAPFTNLGPRDHGAGFDFQFDPLNAGGSFTFKIFFGAAESESGAMSVVADAGVEAYSFGKSNVGGGCSTSGAPNTYIFGFKTGGTPIAECKDIGIQAGPDCEVASISPSDIDNGSGDPEGEAIILVVTPAGPYTSGDNIVSLTVTDSEGLFSSCTATIAVTCPPVAICQNLEIPSAKCELDSVDVMLLDNGSRDPEGGALTFSLSPSGPYSGGVNGVTLTVTDDGGLSSSCLAIVTVNCPPAAVCQNVEIPSASCELDSVDVTLLDNGSSDPEGGALTFSLSPSGPYSGGVNGVTLTVADNFGLSSSCLATVSVNCPPVAVCQDIEIHASLDCQIPSISPMDIDNGSSDPDADVITLAITPPGPYAIGNNAVTLTVTDDLGRFSTCFATVTVTNEDPIVSAGGPYLVFVEDSSTCDTKNTTNIILNGAATDSDSDSLTTDFSIDCAAVVFDDSSSLAAEVSFAEGTKPALCTLTLSATDVCATSNSSTMVVVVDPAAGHVHGWGWIDSPAGAYSTVDTLAGTANFEFVSKYKKGGSFPSGQITFDLSAASFNFQSTSYEWLVVTITGSADDYACAKFKGSGEVNGGEDGVAYGFLLTICDNGEESSRSSAADASGPVNDTFRIQVWRNSDDSVVYDNQVDLDTNSYDGTVLESGNIHIHLPKTSSSKKSFSKKKSCSSSSKSSSSKSKMLRAV